MTHQALPFSAVLFLLLSAACGGGNDDPVMGTGGSPSNTGGSSSNTGGSSSNTGGSAPVDACTATGDITLPAAPANNYSFSSTLSFPPILVAPNTELSFDWSAVDTDFLGHPLDPMADVDTVNLMLWKLTVEELEVKLNDDDLAMRDTAVIATVYTEKMLTSTSLFDFTSVGTPLTPEQILPYVDAVEFPPESHTYTVMLATGEDLGFGTRMIQAFKLDPASTNTEVPVVTTSTGLEYTVDLQSLTPIRLPAGQSGITIDWTGATQNALGNPFETTSITEVLVASYAMTTGEMEADFLDLDLIADGQWRSEVESGTSFSFADLTNEAGAPFAGIDDTRTWVVALFCGGCKNPAPWYMSILEPCAP